MSKRRKKSRDNNSNNGPIHPLVFMQYMNLFRLMGLPGNAIGSLDKTIESLLPKSEPKFKSKVMEVPKVEQVLQNRKVDSKDSKYSNLDNAVLIGTAAVAAIGALSVTPSESPPASPAPPVPASPAPPASPASPASEVTEEFHECNEGTGEFYNAIEKLNDKDVLVQELEKLNKFDYDKGLITNLMSIKEFISDKTKNICSNLKAIMETATQNPELITTVLTASSPILIQLLRDSNVITGLELLGVEN